MIDGQSTGQVTAARVMAHYLPQFHPLPENDLFWGSGFSEWTDVARARPLFRSHRQPEIPADLGFYDLRVPETRVAQAELARRYGVEAFCYWHYWFDGRQVLERPFQEVLESKSPDFPFCVAWANHSWTRVWNGDAKTVLIEQTYPGADDHRRHFAALESAFHDPRYVRVRGKPLFVLFRPDEVPDLGASLDLWRSLAIDSGLGGLHVVGRVDGFWGRSAAEAVAPALDAVIDYSLGYVVRPTGPRRRSIRRLLGRPNVTPYERAIRTVPRLFEGAHSYPAILPRWDSTPRHGRRGDVLRNPTPDAFESMVRHAVALVGDRPADDRLLFLKSWNEWSEGNFIEPDQEWQHGFLEALERAVGA